MSNHEHRTQLENENAAAIHAFAEAYNDKKVTLRDGKVATIQEYGLLSPRDAGS